MTLRFLYDRYYDSAKRAAIMPKAENVSPQRNFNHLCPVYIGPLIFH